MITLTDEDGIRFELDSDLIEGIFRVGTGSLLIVYGSGTVGVLEDIITVSALAVADQINRASGGIN